MERRFQLFAVTVYVELELEGETLQEGTVDLNVYLFRVFLVVVSTLKNILILSNIVLIVFHT